MWLGCFEERTDGVRIHVQQGVWVKVGLGMGTGTQRFWCKVVNISYDGMRIIAAVDNDLLNTSLKCGDQIVLQPCNVLESANLSDCLTFSALAGRVGPRGGAVAWQKARVEKGVAVAPKVETKYVLPI